MILQRCAMVDRIARPLALAFLGLAVTSLSVGGGRVAQAGGVSSYRGTVLTYGRTPPAGAVVVAYAAGDEVARGSVILSSGAARYELVVPADDPGTAEREGAAEGELLSIRVDGLLADQRPTYHRGEERVLDLTVTRLEICLAAYEDLDRDGKQDATEPALAGVTIHVAQFFLVRSYTTAGHGEPSCALHEAHPTVVRAVDWPRGYEPPSGQGQPSIRFESGEGSHQVAFGFVRQTSAVDTATPLPRPSPSPAVSPSPTVTATPTPGAILTVNGREDPGDPGDGELTFREALRLAVGDLWVEDLSPAEQRQVAGQPGPASRDLIVFDRSVFPADQPVTIEIQAPISSRLALQSRGLPHSGLRQPNASLPPLSTGGDTIDGSENYVILSAGASHELFDGLVITSDDNAIRGLQLQQFDRAILVTGEASRNTLGGDGPNQGLTIVDNIAGIELVGPGVRDNRLLGSRIGVERNGHTAAGNATYGIRIADGACDNLIGAPGAGNVISANYVGGVAVVGSGTMGNSIVGNLIGTDAAGKEAIGNGIGIVVAGGAQATQIGGSRALEGNVVSGNVGDGIWVESVGTAGTLVVGNMIGAGLERRRAVGNGGCGILISDGATGTMIGGPGTAYANRIAYNGAAGVRIQGRGTIGHTILGNSITANGGPGVELASGGNRGLAAPHWQRVSLAVVEGWTVPAGLVQVYSDPADQGAQLEGTVLADANGHFRLELLAPPDWPMLTATTTDAEGNTSPFATSASPPTSQPVEPTVTPMPGTEAPTGTSTLAATAPSAGTPTEPTAPAETATQMPARAQPVFFPWVAANAVLFARLALQPAEATVIRGHEHWVEVQLADVVDLRSIRFELRYPPDRLTVVDADPLLPGTQVQTGPFPPAASSVVTDNEVAPEAGRIVYSVVITGPEPLSGSGVLARIQFVASDAGGAPLDWSGVELLDNAGRRLKVAASGAMLRIVEPTASPSATTAATVTPEPTRATPLATTTAPSPMLTATRTPTASPGPTEATVVATSTSMLTAAPTETAMGTPTVVASATSTGTSVGRPSSTATAPPAPSATAMAPPSATTQWPPTQTPTPTATSPAPPTATPSRTPDDGCSHPLVNAGFESDAVWTLLGAWPPRYVKDVVHGGERSMLLGILPGEANQLTYSSLWQPFVVSPEGRQMTVTAWTYQASERGSGPDRQLILLYDVDPGANLDYQRQPIARVLAERSDARAWQRRALTIDVSAYRGQTLWLYASVLNDGLAGRTWMYLDDLDVAICP